MWFARIMVHLAGFDSLPEPREVIMPKTYDDLIAENTELWERISKLCALIKILIGENEGNE
jgi:hypothetical protein